MTSNQRVVGCQKSKLLGCACPAEVLATAWMTAICRRVSAPGDQIKGGKGQRFGGWTGARTGAFPPALVASSSEVTPACAGSV